MIRSALHRISGEPLVHFAVLGAIVFGLHAWVAPPPRTRQIVVPSAVVKELRQQQQERTGSAPSAEAEAQLIQGFVDNEILYREALALGLDRGDIIVRRRLIQKMEFLNEGLEPVPQPTDAQLRTYMEARAGRYLIPTRVTMRHVFISTDAHGAQADRVVAKIRQKLLDGGNPDTLGDPFMRGRHFSEVTEAEVASVFGASFARQVMALPTKTWSAPLRSSYGWHLVRVDDRRPERMPKLAEVRTQLLRDWREDHRQDANRAALKRLRRRYQVTVEEPPTKESEFASANTSMSLPPGRAR